MILQFLNGLSGDLHVTFKEGTAAAWLYDLLKPHVARFVVCNPRRNALLKVGNKSDRIDARKLAELLRGNQLQPVYHACEAYDGPNRERLIVLTLLMLATGLAIGDATMLSKSKVSKNGSGYNVELRRAKTGVAVSCPIPDSLGEKFHALDGETPFWSGKSDLEDLTSTWRKIYGKVFKAAGINGRHPHRFRHTVAKRLLVKDVSAGFVASMLGDSEDIVRHYSKWISERQEAMENAIRATWEG